MVPNREGFFEIAGARLEYRLWNADSAVRPALVLLHEGLGCVAMWREFPDRLAEATAAPVLAFSRAGYGGSSPVEVPRPLSYMHDEARDVVGQVITQSRFDRVVLVGHSDGASIAAIYAGSHRDPRLAGIVLMAPHFIVEDISVKSIAEARAAYDDGDLRARLLKYHGSNVDCAFEGWNRAWLDPAFRAWDLTEFIAPISVPTLLIQGADDQYGTLRQLDLFERHATAPAQRLVLPACGHSPHRDQPGETLAAISAFLATL